jgi:hypothetical protein
MFLDPSLDIKNGCGPLQDPSQDIHKENKTTKNLRIESGLVIEFETFKA